MSQQTTETTHNETTPAADPDFVPHDPGGNDFSSMEIESEDPAEVTTTDAETTTTTDNETTTDDETGAETDSSKAETQEGGAFEYDGKVIEPAVNLNETETEKAQRLQILELQQKLAGIVQKDTNSPTELTEPGFYDAGIDGDPDKYAAAMKAYGIEVGKREAAQAVEQQAQEQHRQQEIAIYEANVKNYDARRAAAKAMLPDIDEADVMLAQNLPQMHQAALMRAGLENPEMVAYALYKNKELREKFSAETNPIRLGVMLADISRKSRLAPKSETPKVNNAPQVKGTQGANPNGNGLSKEFASATFE